MKEGIIWRIGNGKTVRIWEDPWLLKGNTRKPITSKREDAAEILRIPIDEQLEDWTAWHFDAKGLFSVKSAYKLVVAVRDNSSGRDASSSSNEVCEPTNEEKYSKTGGATRHNMPSLQKA